MHVAYVLYLLCIVNIRDPQDIVLITKVTVLLSKSCGLLTYLVMIHKQPLSIRIHFYGQLSCKVL